VVVVPRGKEVKRAPGKEEKRGFTLEYGRSLVGTSTAKPSQLS
jgi:hypothetical protein